MATIQDVINAHSRDLTRILKEHDDLKRRVAALEQQRGKTLERVPVTDFGEPAVDPLLTTEEDGEFEE